MWGIFLESVVIFQNYVGFHQNKYLFGIYLFFLLYLLLTEKIPSGNQHFPAIGHIDLRRILPDIIDQIGRDERHDTAFRRVYQLGDLYRFRRKISSK